ncbi:hypothetical protein VKT23_015192 [Stygiomarasmius scandens]|uniref:F-box domain-containing protein n=1 Tax=Marasmiellus scandens TaxID=2682957 RepID=A0ABR1IYI5_9AGAR
MLIMEQLRACNATLKCCALVCRAWRFPAQRYLFTYMRLSSSTTCNRMNRILRTAPHLAPFVETLAIDHYSPFMSLRNTVSLIERLCNVRILIIHNFSEVNRSSSSRWTLDEIEAVSKLGSVKVVHLQDEDGNSLVPRLFEVFPNLHTFQLFRTDHDSPLSARDIQIEDKPLQRKVALRSLSLPNLESAANSSIVEFFGRPEFDYTNLNSLKLYSQTPYMNDLLAETRTNQINQFLENCGQHLCKLILVFPTEHSPFSNSAPALFRSQDLMHCFPRLKELGLVVHIREGAKLHFLSQGISRIISSPTRSLQSITLDIFMCLRAAHPSIFLDIEPLPGWDALDSFLSEPGNLPDFTELHIRVSIDLDVRYLQFDHTGGDFVRFLKMNLSQEQMEGPIREELTEIFEGRPGTDIMSYAFEA